MKCKNCGSTSFDEDRARADLICQDCGLVLTENAISNEVEFVETSGGQTAAACRFVSDETKRRIDSVCAQLRLGVDVSVSAFRYYQSALFRGITRGRPAFQVAAACIYLAARQMRVNLMLLDLSDTVSINVYMLGRCYNELRRRLHLVIPEMDPCIYIERFAHQLELGDKTGLVASTAMRLLQRMKKDWIVTGRRPSGLAASALLVAARIHEFNRNEEDVARIARISRETAKKRLQEIGRASSSSLSIDDFFSVNYDEEQDPPSFTAAREAEEAVKNLDEKSMAELSGQIKELQDRIDEELEKLTQRCSSKYIKGMLKNIDIAQSKGVDLLLPTSSHSHLATLTNTTDMEDSGGLALKQTVKGEGPVSSSSAALFHRLLDGLVEPELLQSCASDLDLLTRHSGDRLNELLAEAEQVRNMVDDHKSQSVDRKPVAPKVTKLPTFLPVSSMDVLDLPKRRLEKLRVAEQAEKNGTVKKPRRGRRKMDGKADPTSLLPDEKPQSSKINYAALDAIVQNSIPLPSSTVPLDEDTQLMLHSQPSITDVDDSKIIKNDANNSNRQGDVYNTTVASSSHQPEPETTVADEDIHDDDNHQGDAIDKDGMEGVEEEEDEDEEVYEEEEEEYDGDWATGNDLW